MTETRPPLTRHVRGRVLFGVCAGLSHHLRIGVTAVRVMLLVLAFCGGAGLILYLWLWALLPLESEVDDAASEVDAAESDSSASSGSAGVTPPSDVAGDVFWRVASNLQTSYRRNPSLWFGFVIGVVLLLFSTGLGATQLGVDVPWGVIMPLILLGAGVILVWVNLNDTERLQWRRRAGTSTSLAVVRLIGGLALLVLGIVFVVLTATNGTPIFSTILAVAAVLVGISLVLVPFGVRFWRKLLAERAEAARVGERADIAAHLHDSVLQTLALIRRRNADPTEVARLARGQERELRNWLYGDRLEPGSSLADAVRNIAGEIEDLYGVEIDTVIVGDVHIDEPDDARGPDEGARLSALQAAAREAMVNAAVHAGGTVSVYAEFSDTAREVFVRDRGGGFDLDAIDESRHGVRHSIIGRMERYGGAARFVPAASGGTEVRLTMTRREGKK